LGAVWSGLAVSPELSQFASRNVSDGGSSNSPCGSARRGARGRRGEAQGERWRGREIGEGEGFQVDSVAEVTKGGSRRRQAVQHGCLQARKAELRI